LTQILVEKVFGIMKRLHFEFPITRVDEPASNTLALICREHGHGTERSAHGAADRRWTVHNVAHHPTLQDGNKGKQNRTAPFDLRASTMFASRF
jgi:hypothetical protein